MGDEADADWQDGLVEWGLTASPRTAIHGESMSSSVLVPNEALEKTLELVIKLRERNAKLTAALERKLEMRAGELDALDKIIGERDASLEQNTKLEAAFMLKLREENECNGPCADNQKCGCWGEMQNYIALQQSTPTPR